MLTGIGRLRSHVMMRRSLFAPLALIWSGCFLASTLVACRGDDEPDESRRRSPAPDADRSDTEPDVQDRIARVGVDDRGFVLLGHGAVLFDSPGTPALHHQLRISTCSEADDLALTRRFRLVGVSENPERLAIETHGSSVRGACGPPGLVSLSAFRLRFYVAPSDLVATPRQPTRQDRAAFEMVVRAGTAVLEPPDRRGETVIDAGKTWTLARFAPDELTYVYQPQGSRIPMPIGYVPRSSSGEPALGAQSWYGFDDKIFVFESDGGGTHVANACATMEFPAGAYTPIPDEMRQHAPDDLGLVTWLGAPQWLEAHLPALADTELEPWKWGAMLCNDLAGCTCAPSWRVEPGSTVYWSDGSVAGHVVEEVHFTKPGLLRGSLRCFEKEVHEFAEVLTLCFDADAQHAVPQEHATREVRP